MEAATSGPRLRHPFHPQGPQPHPRRAAIKTRPARGRVSLGQRGEPPPSGNRESIWDQWGFRKMLGQSFFSLAYPFEAQSRKRATTFGSQFNCG